jgi:16S rRNA (guanine527-N7)-methyltransferase
MEYIKKHIKNLTGDQLDQLEQLLPLYTEWNQKINVISRKDMDEFYVHHVLHSLSLSCFIQWNPGTRVIDLGCGGGFPGIPLAILFPETEFTLIDSIAKKIRVAQAVAETLGLSNVKAIHTRAEDHKGSCHFVVTRAVAPMGQLLKWSRHLIADRPAHPLPNGLIAYKGGDLRDELREIPKGYFYERWSIHEKIPLAYFEEKYLIYAS